MTEQDAETKLREWGAISYGKRFFEPGEKTALYVSRDGCWVHFRSEANQTGLSAPEGQGLAEIVAYIESQCADKFVEHVKAELKGQGEPHSPCWVCDQRQWLPDPRRPRVTLGYSL